MSKNIVDEYLFYQEKYTKLYGNMTIVFMMVGSFYEAYATQTKGFDLIKVSEITNLAITRKDKSSEKIDTKNPYMMGFNIASYDKFLKMLIDNGFTVVIVDQITPPPKPKRAVTGVYSAGTYMNDTNLDSNNIVSLYIEDEKQKSGKYLSCIGLSAIDLTTGECSVYETFPTITDEKYSLDEAYRFIISHNPKEIIISRKEVPQISIKKENLLTYLELENKNIHYCDNVNKNYYKLSYQNDFFGKVYNNIGMHSPIEAIDMEKMYYARISFIILLDFAYKHNENLINYLNKPIIFYNNKHLILGNNAIYQLNILENNSIDAQNIKYKCLFDVVNQTSTAMGRRFLKNTICHPLNDVDEINTRYNCIEELIQDDLYLVLEKHLSLILDLERLSRKIFLCIIQPYEMANLIESFQEIGNIYKLLKNTKYNIKFIPDNNILKKLDTFLKKTKDIFNLEQLKKQNINDITRSFFNRGIYTQIDELDDKVANNLSTLQEICQVLSSYIEDKNPFQKNKKNNNDKNNNDNDENNDENDDNNEEKLKIQLKRNDRDGYYLILSKKRAQCLEKKIKNMDYIIINDTLKINPKEIQFKELKDRTKMIFENMQTASCNIDNLKEKLIGLIKKKYNETLTLFSTSFNDMFKLITKSMAILDFIKSCAKTAKRFNYCKPTIIQNDDNGYFKAIKLRHPIAERLRTDIEYVPHDLSLGKPCGWKQNDELLEGMLLFGLNSAGKTTLMKAVGLNLIMAQCGMYVAAENYEYSPYESVFARITGNDNIFKGLSSFALEMTELDAIFNRSGPKTLVIGDEITRGTETISGASIITASLIYLAQSHCSFIFATHLHEIVESQRIKDLNNIKMFHLTVSYDKDQDVLVFDRILKPGSGDSVYGLTVARHIIKNKDFIKLAQEIKNEIMEQNNTILPDKTSKYNANLYIDACQICGKQNTNKKHTGYLDTHHINFQSNCNEDGFVIGKSYLPMNAKSNLIVLCKLCHHQVHHEELVIKGYKETSKGRMIDYKFKSKSDKNLTS